VVATALKRAEDIHFAEVDDEFYVTLENRDVVACLNRSAFAVLENLDGFSTVDHIGGFFGKALEVDTRRMRSAVKKTTSTLRDLGIVEDVELSGPGTKRQLVLMGINKEAALPEVMHVWQGEELVGGLFMNSEGGDIHVIVPNVTDGPIKTCPPHTCTIPAGLFTAQTIIRTFDPTWRANFEQFRRSGFVHFARR
jgi:hypothetical protein